MKKYTDFIKKVDDILLEENTPYTDVLSKVSNTLQSKYGKPNSNIKPLKSSNQNDDKKEIVFGYVYNYPDSNNPNSLKPYLLLNYVNGSDEKNITAVNIDGDGKTGTIVKDKIKGLVDDGNFVNIINKKMNDSTKFNITDKLQLDKVKKLVNTYNETWWKLFDSKVYNQNESKKLEERIDKYINNLPKQQSSNNDPSGGNGGGSGNTINSNTKNQQNKKTETPIIDIKTGKAA